MKINVIACERARYQPAWLDAEALKKVTQFLLQMSPLVKLDEILRLRQMLAKVYLGEAVVLQAGDCAESFNEMNPARVKRKLNFLQKLGNVFEVVSGHPVVKAGRLGGQFSKPRSSSIEKTENGEIIPYFGDAINGFSADIHERTPNPYRMMIGFLLAQEVHRQLRFYRSTLLEYDGFRENVWSSHEALLLDYELPQLRWHMDGIYLASGHWPWVGNRTRQVKGEYVKLLSRIDNPVACKIGPGISPDEVVDLAKTLNARRIPGHLTFVARFGVKRIRAELPPIVAAIRECGVPVIWLIDPLHGNTVKEPPDIKTRSVNIAIEEVTEFRDILRDADVHAGGLHLEVTDDPSVIECTAHRGKRWK